MVNQQSNYPYYQSQSSTALDGCHNVTNRSLLQFRLSEHLQRGFSYIVNLFGNISLRLMTKIENVCIEIIQSCQITYVQKTVPPGDKICSL